MKKCFLRVVIASIVLCLPTISCTQHGAKKPVRVQDYQGTIRVACVGDSITYGHGITNRLKGCYPAQLGQMLGDQWEVRNFGVSAATMLKQGDLPYWKQQAFKDVLAYNPNVVIIKLGTNDTKPQNWRFKDEFARDYLDMIDQFSKLPAQPRIWICYPVPAFGDRWGINEFVIKNEVIPIISQVARKKRVPIINLYQLLSGKPKYFPDDIHPDAEGAFLIAKEIYKTLTGTQFMGVYKEPPLPQVLIIGDSISIGYFEPTQKLLEGKADVVHNPGNAAHTANGLQKLTQWLGDTQWDVIHFNHGLHDLKYIDEKGKNIVVEKGKQQIPIEDYEINLEAIVTRLKATGAKLIFATTTPVPDGTGIRVKGDAEKYNRVALQVMNRHGIAIDDLYSFALPRLGDIQRPKNVHFTPQGSELLAEQVANSILKALEER
ncbi:MAG: SGNH/GDSL hydrolase family protein [Sedimentisphaerales bacterium]|nr:SGNH/GDSL hydrolase family protein [Sedimentisphaerales bacterium]